MSSHGELKWNRGGWIGSQLGGSVWIFVAGVLTLPENLMMGLTVIALSALANLIGWGLWRNREKLTAYAGIQILLPVLGICGAATIYLLEQAQLYETIQYGGTVSAARSYLLLLVMVSALMFMFYIRFGRNRSDKSSDK